MSLAKRLLAFFGVETAEEYEEKGVGRRRLTAYLAALTFVSSNCSIEASHFSHSASGRGRQGKEEKAVAEHL